MRQPEALVNLIGEEKLLETEGGITIKILLSNLHSTEPLISQMARELNIDFIFLGGEFGKYQIGVLGSILINIKEKDFYAVSEYLSKREIHWKKIS